MQVRELEVEVEPERVSGGRPGGVPPQLAHLSESAAGPDALHVGEDHGRDVHAGIKDRLPRIGCRHVARGRDGDVARVRVSESWLSVVAFSLRKLKFHRLTNYPSQI